MYLTWLYPSYIFCFSDNELYENSICCRTAGCKNYQGHRSRTKSGKICQRWGSKNTRTFRLSRWKAEKQWDEVGVESSMFVILWTQILLFCLDLHYEIHKSVLTKLTNFNLKRFSSQGHEQDFDGHLLWNLVGRLVGQSSLLVTSQVENLYKYLSIAKMSKKLSIQESFTDCISGFLFTQKHMGDPVLNMTLFNHWK